MCGIIGYTGRRPAGPIVIDGLKRLEYRGYDSAGIALIDDRHELYIARAAGKLDNLDARIEGSLPPAVAGIGHTRWATHGEPSDANAHPHLDPEGRVAVVHNGIVENFEQLRARYLERGAAFASQTRQRGDRAHVGRPPGGRRRPGGGAAAGDAGAARRARHPRGLARRAGAAGGGASRQRRRTRDRRRSRRIVRRLRPGGAAPPHAPRALPRPGRGRRRAGARRALPRRGRQRRRQSGRGAAVRPGGGRQGPLTGTSC